MPQDTTAVLIQRVKNLETIPDSGAAYSDDVLLEYLDQSLKGFIVPAIEATMEEHFVVTKDFPMAGQPPYPGNNPPVDVGNSITIPGTSTGLRLRDVYVVGNDGSFYNLPRLTPSQAAAQSYGNPWGPGNVTSNAGQFVGGFFLQGNTVQIFPYGLASNKTIRITFQRAPADLCLTDVAGKVTSVTGDVVQIDKTLQWYGGITQVGIISGETPNEFVQDPNSPVTVYTSYTPLDDVTLVNVSGNVITLPGGVGDAVSVGDWLCPAGYSVFAQSIPKEILPALCRKAAEMCLEAAGDREGQKVAMDTYNSMIKMSLMQLAPRVIGKPTKILPNNSAFRASKSSNFGRF